MRSLASAGLRPDQPLALVLPNCIEFVLAWYGTLHVAVRVAGNEEFQLLTGVFTGIAFFADQIDGAHASLKGRRERNIGDWTGQRMGLRVYVMCNARSAEERSWTVYRPYGAPLDQVKRSPSIKAKDKTLASPGLNRTSR